MQKSIKPNCIIILILAMQLVTASAQIIVRPNDVELTKRLSVNGKIKLGDDASAPTAGSVRFNGTNGDFEGFNGSEWVSLTKTIKPWGGAATYTEQTDKQTSSNGGAGDGFGYAVAIDGDYAIVGAPNFLVGGYFEGRAYIFKKNGENWVEQSTLEPYGGFDHFAFGASVAIDGNYAIVGAPGLDNGRGSAYIFLRTGNNWALEQIISHTMRATNDYFGQAVAISGNYAVVGAPLVDVAQPSSINFDQGKVFVFERNGSSWAQTQEIIKANGDNLDNFGQSVSLDGSYLALGAPNFNSGNISDSGSVSIYFRATTTFELQAEIAAEDKQQNDRFGTSVDIDNNNLIGGTSPDGSRGRAYIFTRFNTAWLQAALLRPSDPELENYFGFRVAISGNYAVVGAHKADFPMLVDRGKVYVYGKNSSTSWVQQARLSASDSEAYDELGYAVAISGEDIIVGALKADPGGNVNKGRVYFYK